MRLSGSEGPFPPPRSTEGSDGLFSAFRLRLRPRVEATIDDEARQDAKEESPQEDGDEGSHARLSTAERHCWPANGPQQGVSDESPALLGSAGRAYAIEAMPADALDVSQDCEAQGHRHGHGQDAPRPSEGPTGLQRLAPSVFHVQSNALVRVSVLWSGRLGRAKIPRVMTAARGRV